MAEETGWEEYEEELEREEAGDGDEQGGMQIRAFTDTIMEKRQEAVEGRAACGIERRWREDEWAFDGLDPSTDGPADITSYATGEAYVHPSTDAKRSKVLINIIRGKCETSYGRFAEILLPVDDRNFGLKVTPIPDLVEAMDDETPIEIEGEEGQPGQPLQTSDGENVTVADAAQKEMEEADKKMEAMQTAIDDQLTECSYNGECRKVVMSAVKIGTGILKGPFVTKKIRKAWTQTKDETGEAWSMQILEEFTPESKFVDPWDVYPDPNCSGEIRKAAYIWERDSILPRELRMLVGVDGYLEDQIEMVLKEEPKRTLVVDDEKGRYQLQQNCVSMGSAYERWFYNGDVAKEDLAMMGVEVSEGDAAMISCCVEFVNDRPIKVSLNMLDSGELPYDFFQWTQITGSVWGLGVARMAIWQQRVITAAWRAMMDNAGDSSGVNTIVKQGVSPMDDKWELTGKKLWWADEEIDDVRQAFFQFQVGNNQVELQNIIELALRFIDMETQIPMMFQGEQGKLPETLGATNIMVDSNNVALRSRVKIWDDNITRPHITRFYDWNMLYNPDNNIKGDFNVDPRGTSVLLEKDRQGQTLMEILPLKNDPDFKMSVDWDKVAANLFSAKRLDVMKPEDQIKKDREEMSKQEPPVDPTIQAAQVRADTEMKKAEQSAASTQAELEFKKQMQTEQNEHELEMKTADLQIAMLGYAEQKDMNLDKIKADLTKEAGKLNLQRELAGPDKEGPQVVTPTLEPEGRAKEGRAFQD